MLCTTSCTLIRKRIRQRISNANRNITSRKSRELILIEIYSGILEMEEERENE